MVCVTKQKTCGRLIGYGQALLKSDEDNLHIIHVTDKEFNFLGESKEERALEFLYEKSREAGAELTVLKSHDVVKTLGELARSKNITKVVAGASSKGGSEQGFLLKLHDELEGKAQLLVVPPDFQ